MPGVSVVISLGSAVPEEASVPAGVRDTRLDDEVSPLPDSTRVDIADLEKSIDGDTLRLIPGDDELLAQLDRERDPEADCEAR